MPNDPQNPFQPSGPGRKPGGTNPPASPRGVPGEKPSGAPWRPLTQEERVMAGQEPPDEGEKKKKKKKKQKDAVRLGSDRGIETMFRTSYMTHVELSALADSKSNIMITINGLIMSILIGGVSSKIDTNTWLLLPTSFLLLGCMFSMVYAVRAARPRVTSRLVSLDDVRQNKANILFFGNFVNMSEGDYVQGMTELMQKTDSLYYNMIRDIYGLGQVLDLKFRMLRISYTLFMVALGVGVFLFLVVFVGIAWFTPAAPVTTVPVVP